jgi:lambda repressor-like predicted transcriptional regulator
MSKWSERAILTMEQMEEADRLMKSGNGLLETALKFRVSKNSLKSLLYRFRMLGDHENETQGAGSLPDDFYWSERSRITKDQMIECVELKKEGWSNEKLGMRYGVDRSTIRDCFNRIKSPAMQKKFKEAKKKPISIVEEPKGWDVTQSQKWLQVSIMGAQA